MKLSMQWHKVDIPVTYCNESKNNNKILFLKMDGARIDTKSLQIIVLMTINMILLFKGINNLPPWAKAIRGKTIVSHPFGYQTIKMTRILNIFLLGKFNSKKIKDLCTIFSIPIQWFAWSQNLKTKLENAVDIM